VAHFPDPDLWYALAIADRLPHGISALGVRTIPGVMLQIDKSLEECRRCAGPAGAYRIRTVTVPLLWPGLIAAWCCCFVASIASSRLDPADGAAFESDHALDRGKLVRELDELTAAMALIQTAVVAIAVSIMIAVTRRATTHMIGLGAPWTCKPLGRKSKSIASKSNTRGAAVRGVSFSCSRASNSPCRAVRLRQRPRHCAPSQGWSSECRCDPDRRRARI